MFTIFICLILFSITFFYLIASYKKTNEEFYFKVQCVMAIGFSAPMFLLIFTPLAIFEPMAFFKQLLGYGIMYLVGATISPALFMTLLREYSLHSRAKTTFSKSNKMTTKIDVGGVPMTSEDSTSLARKKSMRESGGR